MRILIVDDQRGARAMLSDILHELTDVDVVEAKSVGEANACIDAAIPDLMLVDIRLSSDPEDRGGFDIARRVGKAYPYVPVVVVTASSEIDSIRQAMRLGAKDYVLKDELSPELLLPIVNGFRERMALRGEVARLRERLDREFGIPSIIGSSATMKQVREAVRRVAESEGTVLIRGEPGTGKKMVARAIHETSARREHRFVAVSCLALPPAEMEALLFGQQDGPTGDATSRRLGQFEAAGRGTILFEDVAEMSLELQAKFVRVLDDRTFRPIGSSADAPFLARVLVSTQVELESRLANGSLRADLYYRLNAVTVSVPPLRERRKDIPELLHAFGTSSPRTIHFASDAVTSLTAHAWPGNVRELRNVVERLSILAESSIIDRESLALHLTERHAAEMDSIERVADRLVGLPGTRASNIDALERHVLARVLEECGGNWSAAARRIGVERRVLVRWWRKLGGDAIADDPGDPSD
jgi:DNA-binding NtrC family response regulator